MLNGKEEKTKCGKPDPQCAHTGQRRQEGGSVLRADYSRRRGEVGTVHIADEEALSTAAAVGTVWRGVGVQSATCETAATKWCGDENALVQSVSSLRSAAWRCSNAPSDAQ